MNKISNACRAFSYMISKDPSHSPERQMLPPLYRNAGSGDSIRGPAWVSSKPLLVEASLPNEVAGEIRVVSCLLSSLQQASLTTYYVLVFWVPRCSLYMHPHLF